MRERAEQSKLQVEVEAQKFEDQEMIIFHGKDSYPMVYVSSYGPEVVNPTIQELELALSGDNDNWINNSSRTVLVPMQANGRCIANCRGCVFAADVVGDSLKRGSVSLGREIAAPIKPDAMQVLLDRASEDLQCEYRLGAVLSGDPAFNTHSLDVMKTVIDNQNVVASRWSTVAPKTGINVLGNFIRAASYLNEVGVKHRLHFQVSLHSTDDKERARYINHHSGTLQLKPIPKQEISEAFKIIYEKTGKPSTLAFIVDNTDVPLDVDVLKDHFEPEYTWISLRPRIPTPEYNIGFDQQKLLEKYAELRLDGWSVMVAPPTKTSMEQHNLAIKAK